MIFHKSITILSLAIVWTIWLFHLTDAECNVCQENGAACVNLTSFHLCFGGNVPDTTQLFTCGDGLECTDLPTICFQSSTRPASCGDTSSCGCCNNNQVFACTSRTTFALCFGATEPSDVRGECPFGKICDAASPGICVTQAQANSIICDTSTPLTDSEMYFSNRNLE